jgi:hypothetical protein
VLFPGKLRYLVEAIGSYGSAEEGQLTKTELNLQGGDKERKFLAGRAVSANAEGDKLRGTGENKCK